jgi:DNA-binding protein
LSRRCIVLSKEDQNIVYIGRKPPMNYVTAIISSFTGSSAENVILKARGRSITTAVDAAEITRRRFMKELKTTKIRIGTEELQLKEGGTKNVSTMEITLARSLSKKKAEEKTTKSKSTIIQPIELTNIAGIGAKRAENLNSHGITSVQDLAKLDPKELSKKLKISDKRVTKWINAAKEILNK